MRFNPEPLPGDRHPQGRTSRDPKILAAALLLMPYALVRYALDCRRGRP